MMYVAWAAFYEGSTDSLYLNVLIPRLLEEILRVDGRVSAIIPEAPAILLGQNGRGRQQVATEICDNREAFRILFFHSDTGGRGLEAGIADRRESFIEQANILCGFSLDHVVYVSPRNETEAWALADREALRRSLGIVQFPDGIEIPNDARAAEALADPKAVFASIIRACSRRSRRFNPAALLPRIAQGQSIESLRHSRSFHEFEEGVRDSLRSFRLLT